MSFSFLVIQFFFKLGPTICCEKRTIFLIYNTTSYNYIIVHVSSCLGCRSSDSIAYKPGRRQTFFTINSYKKHEITRKNSEVFHQNSIEGKATIFNTSKMVKKCLSSTYSHICFLQKKSGIFFKLSWPHVGVMYFFTLLAQIKMSHSMEENK